MSLCFPDRYSLNTIYICETLEIYNLTMRMCKPSCKRKIKSGNISMSDGNQD